MPTLSQFTAQRRCFETQFFTSPNPLPQPRTIMLCSHIWWTEQMAYTLLNLGHNVLVHYPPYLLYTDDEAWPHFDKLWNGILHDIRNHNVDLIIAGNSTGIVPHPKTGELLHQAAKVPIVNYWWDEPRTTPPFAKRLPLTPDDYLRFLRDDKTLNAIWDIDILEELAAFHNITNTFHLPLATLPEYWHQPFFPLEKRKLAATFLGNCHGDVSWVETDPDPLTAWARSVITIKCANLERSMKSAIDSVGHPPTSSPHLSARPDPWTQFFLPWEILNATYMHRTRNLLIQSAYKKLHGNLALIGKGWEKLNIRANAEHAGENSGPIYSQSKASLNLFGGCVHAGMPLRPFDIAASAGLIVTHYNRELPDLFDPATECLAFKSEPELLTHLDHILTRPQDFNHLVHNAYRRTLDHHTWHHRLQKLLDTVTSKNL